MKAALYHRVSTLDQNPELARDELHAAVAARGARVVLDVEETGSGAKNDRPGLARIMEAARRGQLDAVMVWKLDRFGRSALDLLANVDELDRCGVRFVATSQGLEFGAGAGAIGKLLLTVLAGVAEFERELIRERTRLGHAKARKEGKHIGRPRAQLTPGIVGHAADIRRGGPPGVIRPGWQPPSWRQVVRELGREGVQNVPDQATLAAACLKAYPDLPRGRRGWPRL